jgi:hypothetical protein
VINISILNEEKYEIRGQIYAKFQNPTTTPSVRISNEPEERRKKEEEREKNAIYSGHLRLCQQPRAAHALRSDQKKQAGAELCQAQVKLC